jgi:hypothetical protein
VIARLARHTAVRLAFFTVLATVLVWPLLPDAARLNEFRDVHFLFLYERAALDTITRFGELPLWNPYYCGGFDAVAAPQTRFVSPTLLLGLLFGAQRAEIVTVFLLSIVGMEGMYRWLRLRVDEPFAAMVIAPVFALTGQLAVAYYRGWIHFFGFQLVPWILYGITLAARRRPAGMAIASVAFATMLGFAGFFAAPMLAVAAVLEAGRALFEQPRSARGRSLAMLLATASFMATVAWLRLWPVTETLLSAPRIMAGTPGHTPRELLSALVSVLAVKDGNTDLAGSFFVGAAFLGLAALGAHGRRGIVGLGLAFVMVWLASGYARSPSLFGLLRELPGFAALRYPERFLWLAVLFASLPAALALAHVPFAGEGRRWRVGVATALGLAVAWTLMVQVGAFQRVASLRSLGSVAEGVTPPGEFHQARGNRWLAVHFESMGIGSLSCYETNRLAESPLLRGDLPAEEYLAPDSADAGSVKRLSWSPNTIALHVDVTRPARVLVNQNWAPGWHASLGKVVSHEGLIAVDVPAGARDLKLTFLPWTTLGGAATTLVALLALAFLGLRARRHGELFSPKQRVVTALVVALPWAVAGAAFAASPDARWPPPAMTNPNGSNAVVAEGEPLGDVTEAGARFELPLRVEAGNVSAPDTRGNVTVEVLFRRLGSLSRATTMFVHVERRSGQGDAPAEREDFFNADHQVVGGSFYLSEAPKGALVRDAFGVHLDRAASGTWDVWVAFGHVSGKRGRSRVVEPGKATVSDDRVRVGTFVVP